MNHDLSKLGYKTVREKNLTLIYKLSVPQLRESALTERALGEPSPFKGRSRLHIIPPDMVVRPLMHGGLFRHLTGRLFLSSARTIRELKVSRYLTINGVPTPEILAVRLIRKGLFYSIDVVSRLVPDSMDLMTCLETPRTDVSEILMKAGTLVRKIHDLGIYHADLHIKNLLMDSAGNLWVLDLDKARLYATLPGFMKRLNIGRFMRSMKKWERKGRIHLPNDWQRCFMTGYLG
ncbi:MAG TPA: lipopolysaccharide kinase InaA family protein [Desulfomonilia bacterium]|nr:lipopolysaccharide kinase InaA family protein [Desulfomonilia bacterium]